VAVEMARSGDLVTPTLQGRPWLEKPVLYYWLAGGCFRLLGESETAARLPSVLAALVLVGATALVGARLFGAAAGLHAGFVLGTCLLTFAYGRAAAMDMLLAAAVTLATGLLGLRALGIAGRLAVPAAMAAIGVATLAKGPLGILLPGLVLLGYVAATREWRQLRAIFAPTSLLAFAVVALPWYALVLRAQGMRFVDVFLLNHNLERFTTTVHHHPGSALYYLPVILAGLFPWSGLSIPGLAGLRPRRERADLYLLLWLALPLVFFSAAGSKLPGYILPVLPPLAILMGRAAARLSTPEAERRPAAWNRLVALVGLVLGALVACIPAVLRSQGEPRFLDTLPLGLWAVAVMFTISRRLDKAPAAALAVWRVGAAGLLLLVATAAPPILARSQSGRGLFLPAHGREVLAWGAWRTAWMAGYFYDDARVREVSGRDAVDATLAAGPALVLCGPAQRRELESDPRVKARVLAEGPRRNVLLRLSRLAGG
jgi:4-amino-4-deoxy-L-arabinose transferase-like glycosyltransferase